MFNSQGSNSGKNLVMYYLFNQDNFGVCLKVLKSDQLYKGYKELYILDDFRKQTKSTILQTKLHEPF